MLTRLLASELKNSPQINQEYIQAGELFNKHKECINERDVTMLGIISRKSYACLHTRGFKLQLPVFESNLRSAKHAVCATSELEDFV